MNTQAEAPTFTTDWFSEHIPLWEQLKRLLPSPDKILEIGSFEGQSSCWILQNMLADDGTLVCIDTWEGSPEFPMYGVSPEITEASYVTFCRNVSRVRKIDQTVATRKARSVDALAQLAADRHSGFDLIYVDGSHRAQDTLTDAVMSWPLLKERGFLVFDDYTWIGAHSQDILERPKMAIDAFMSIFDRELHIIYAGKQAVVQKR